MIKNCLFICCLILLLSGCKVTQTVSNEENTSEDTLVVLDTLSKVDTLPKEAYLVTQKGDTLDSLGMEVAIPIYRLLPDTVTIAAVGDIMMGTSFPKSSYLPAGNGDYLWKDSSPYLQAADITFGNLEGTVLDGEGEPKNCRNPDACFLFKMPPYLASNLKENGFDLMSLANNHANDFGKTGRLSTQRTMDSLGIGTAGALEAPYSIYKMDHLKVGFIAFAPNIGTLTFYDLQKAKDIVSEMDTLADLIIVSIHGGAEGAKNMHVTREKEYYYGEDRGNIYEFSHEMIEAGADLILGHGPHIVRAIEVYKSRLIAYSLGNFLTYGRFNLEGPNGEAPLLTVKTDAAGRFLEGQIVPFKQSYSYGPVYDENNTAIKSIKKLSEEDFPENEIIIDDTGRIFYIQY